MSLVYVQFVHKLGNVSLSKGKTDYLKYQEKVSLNKSFSLQAQ